MTMFNPGVMSMIAAAMASIASAQPVQWRVEDGGNGHWYELIQGFTWHDSKTAAESKEGELASPTSVGENEFVRNLMQTRGVGAAFLGGFVLEGSPCVNSSWRWSDGSEWAFTNWDVGQPECNGEECAVIYNSGVWHSYFYLPSPPIFAAVCEWSADCNNDGIVDKGQILSGELADANNNGIPDFPAVSVQPQDQASADGGSVSFTVQVATGAACSTPVTYRWQRRNPAVPDPAAPGAWFDLADDGTFANTDRPTMTVVRPGPALATGYRCKIGGGCGCEPNPGGFIYTDTVNFSIACPADFNADGGIDFGDVEAFFERWENGC
jgi:hypothetical protein